MSVPAKKTASPAMVIIAFATVYLVWGSTYFFIQIAVKHFPPMILGAFRFLTAGLLLMGWCFIRGERPGTWKQMKPAIITGLMLLLGGTGAVIWAEKWLPSSMVAVLIFFFTFLVHHSGLSQMEGKPYQSFHYHRIDLRLYRRHFNIR
jgi:drug/metabolite transporter (DMT)-like permease